MTSNDLNALTPGLIYRVKHKGGITTRRVFKWMETRLGSIPCAVFSSKVIGDLTVERIEDGLRFSGRIVPRGEISIPAYDLEEVNP